MSIPTDDINKYIDTGFYPIFSVERMVELVSESAQKVIKTD